MNIGDLVRNTRASIGIPRDSVGLITGMHFNTANGYYIYEIQWLGRRIEHSRRLARDLELLG